MTEDEVRDIIDGKNVVAPIKQIQEVKNAIATYELYPKLNPFSVKDLLKAHQGEPLPDKVPSEVPNKVPDKVPNKLRNKYPELSDAAWDVYTMIKGDTSITSKELGAALGISDRMVRKYISMLREANLIVRMGSNKTGYWKVNTAK